MSSPSAGPVLESTASAPSQRTAAADDDVLARDRAGVWSEQERRELGNFFWRNEPPDRRRLRRGPDSVGIDKHWRCSGRRCNHVAVICLVTSSAAHDLAKPISAALVAAYWLRPATPAAARLPMSTMRPPAANLSASWLTSTSAASTCTAHIAAPPDSLNAPNRAVCINPAAWTIACTLVIEVSACRSCAWSWRSTCKDWNRSESRFTAERLIPITDHPPPRRRVTMALPIPELAPVTSASLCGLDCITSMSNEAGCAAHGISATLRGSRDCDGRAAFR